MKCLSLSSICFIGSLLLTNTALAEHSRAPMHKSCSSAIAVATVGYGPVNAVFLTTAYDHGHSNGYCYSSLCNYVFYSNGGGEFAYHDINANNVRYHWADCD